jgi:DNA polymerase-3 subunit gamma/tau
VQGRLDDDEVALLAPLADRIPPEDVQLYNQIALAGRRDLQFCRDARMGFEMTLLRMLAFRPGGDSTPAPGPRAGESRSRAGATASGGTAAPPPVAHGPVPERGIAGGGEVTPEDAQAPLSGASRSSSAVNGGNHVRDVPRTAELTDWFALLRELDLRGPARQLADHCDLQSTAGGAWSLVLPPDKQHLNTQQLRGRLEAALKEHMGRELRVSIVPGTPARPTPADLRRANENERMRAAREAIESDPNVRALQAQLDATIEADSIRPTK